MVREQRRTRCRNDAWLAVGLPRRQLLRLRQAIYRSALAVIAAAPALATPAASLRLHLLESPQLLVRCDGG